ncbi:MAG TPA: gamma carbonic anhydrase family protein [Terriglobia bacterium]|nr:gamma carbonic anhydrase family protein [Terriglobia bacterium]
MIRSIGGLHPRIAATAYVDESAQVIGDVVLGEHSSVWPNAVLRGDMHWIRVGDYTNIQDHCVLHVEENLYGVTLEDHITVGHRAILHGCYIERRCLIGMGSIVLNNARVGWGSIIAAGSVVPENTVIPPRSLVMGVPGTVRRATTDADLAKIDHGAEAYVRWKERYLAELRNARAMVLGEALRRTGRS